MTFSIIISINTSFHFKNIQLNHQHNKMPRARTLELMFCLLIIYIGIVHSWPSSRVTHLSQNQEKSSNMLGRIISTMDEQIEKVNKWYKNTSENLKKTRKSSICIWKICSRPLKLKKSFTIRNLINKIKNNLDDINNRKFILKMKFWTHKLKGTCIKKFFLNIRESFLAA